MYTVLCLRRNGQRIKDIPLSCGECSGSMEGGGGLGDGGWCTRWKSSGASSRFSAQGIHVRR